MAYSYSAIKAFQNCPRQYYETRVLKKWAQDKTEQIIYGEEVHKALEDYVKEGKALGIHSRFKPVADTLKSLPGEKLTEFKMALDYNLEPCDFFAPDVFMRGIADITILNEPKATAYVGDYKTGKANYPDIDQLELMALMIFRHFPSVKVVKGALLFIVHDHVVTEKYESKEQKQRWRKWFAKVEQIEAAQDANVWNESPSGLCGYCPVENCPHYKPAKYKK